MWVGWANHLIFHDSPCSPLVKDGVIQSLPQVLLAASLTSLAFIYLSVSFPILIIFMILLTKARMLKVPSVFWNSATRKRSLKSSKVTWSVKDFLKWTSNWKSILFDIVGNCTWHSVLNESSRNDSLAQIVKHGSLTWLHQVINFNWKHYFFPFKLMFY